MTVLSVEVEAALLLPAVSVATPAAIVATTVPEIVMPVTATRRSSGRRLTVPVLTPPELPPTVTSPVAKPNTVSLNTAVKTIGLTLVGSAWPTAWLMVTVGAVRSIVTVAPLVTALPLPARSVTPLTRRRTISVPSEQPVTVTVYAAPDPAGAPKTHAVAVPTFERSFARSPTTVSLKVRSKTGLAAFVMLSAFEMPVSEAAWRSMIDRRRARCPR